MRYVLENIGNDVGIKIVEPFKSASIEAPMIKSGKIEIEDELCIKTLISLAGLELYCSSRASKVKLKIKELKLKKGKKQKIYLLPLRGKKISNETIESINNSKTFKEFIELLDGVTVLFLYKNLLKSRNIKK